MIYLGTLGRMVGIKCPSSQSVEAEDRYTFKTTLEGRRKAQPKPVARRTWSLQTSDATTPAEHSVLSQFAQGAWGPGPFHFVPADAPHTNLLHPGVASCDPDVSLSVQGGPAQLPDGSWAARTLLGDGVSSLFFSTSTYRVPTPLSGLVSAGCWVQGAGAGAGVRLSWHDSAGVYLGASPLGTTSAGGWHWSTITATPPVGAAQITIYAEKGTRGALPVITWGSVKPTAWADGQGCVKAVVSAFSRDQVLAVPGSTFSNVSFTVTEVG